MDELCATIGKQHLEIEQRKVSYSKLLDLLAKVVSGEIDRSRVLVNRTDETYLWSDPGTRPGTPATVNGLPVVVMAPDVPPLCTCGWAKSITDSGRNLAIIETEKPEKPDGNAS